MVPGGTYFFTVVTYNRKSLLASSQAVDLLRDVFRQVKVKRPFAIDAIVILPDHFHCVLTLPQEDNDYPLRIGLIKSNFSRRYALAFSPDRDGSNGDILGDIWQRRYWEHLIRNEDDYTRHLDYIHYNPVKHALVKSPREWRWSSFHDHVAKKHYDINWGVGEVITFDEKIGAE